MNEILHANIFFVIASVATVVFIIMVCILLYHGIKILIAIRTIVERVAKGSEMITDDMVTFRRFVFGGGLISHLAQYMSPKRTKRRKTAADDITRESE